MRGLNRYIYVTVNPSKSAAFEMKGLGIITIVSLIFAAAAHKRINNLKNELSRLQEREDEGEQTV